MFNREQDFIGKTAGIAGEHLTGREMAAALSQALGKAVTYNPIPFESYRKLGFPGAEDLGNMFQSKHDFNNVFCGAGNQGLPRSLNLFTPDI